MFKRTVTQSITLPRMRRDVQTSRIRKERESMETRRLSVLSMLCALQKTENKLLQTQNKSSRGTLGKKEQQIYSSV